MPCWRAVVLVAEEVQQEDDAKKKVADREAMRKEREEQKRMRRETKKGTNIQSGMAHLQKKKKKMTKQEKMKADALWPAMHGRLDLTPTPDSVLTKMRKQKLRRKTADADEDFQSEVD